MRRILVALMGLVVAGVAPVVVAQGGIPVVTPAPPICVTAISVASPASTAAAVPLSTPAGCDVLKTAPTIELYDLGFRPNVLTIRANAAVTLTLHNVGVALHTFSIDALHISVTVLPRETRTIVVRAPQGHYTFYCDIPGHRALGMVGTLIAR